MFTKYDGHGALTSYLVFHVGAILSTCTDDGVELIEGALRTFRSGETKRLGANSPIISTGLLIERDKDQSISLSRTKYAQDIKKAHPIDFGTDKRTVDPDKLRAALRQAPGALV